MKLRSCRLILWVVFSLFILNNSAVIIPRYENITITIAVDNTKKNYSIPSGSTVSQAIKKAGITLNALDKVTPALNTPISQGLVITIIRVTEVFHDEQKVIQFAQQIVKNESLPEGETHLIQQGKNGIQLITYKTVLEDNRKVSDTIVSTEIITPAVPEILLIGIQSDLPTLEIPGTIAYLTAGNAWIMDRNTGNRIPVDVTGKLDGFIFDLSSDGKWLLYTRKLDNGNTGTHPINELYAADVTKTEIHPVSLGIKNVISHAAWVPDSNLTISFSTAEPRITSPGWQSNNDLHLLSFSADGNITRNETILEPNAGGLYGWWGTSFLWAPNGKQLAYSRPDSIGMVNVEKKELVPLITYAPIETGGNWAWVPEITWSPNGDMLYYTKNTSNNSSNATFNLEGLVTNNITIPLIANTGAFTYPTASPPDTYGRFMIAYLKANNPQNSSNSLYMLHIMDQDGSNDEAVFPKSVGSGLKPQQAVWGMGSRSARRHLALLYDGNLWILSLEDMKSQQITNDNSIVKLDWE